jgi:hypothetical protein
MSMSQYSVVSNAPRTDAKSGGRLTSVRNVILALLLIAVGTMVLAMLELSMSPPDPAQIEAILAQPM